MTPANYFKCLLASAALLFTGSFAARAGVVPGDTFTFDISGFNQAGTIGFLLTPDETSTFGTTQTYVGAGINGQNITITSNETVNGLMTTDLFTVSTPTNFLTTNKVSGTTITQLQFDLGNANSGSNTVDFLLPITGYTATGSTLYSGGTLALTPSVTTSNGDTSLSAVEGVTSGASAISGFKVHQFTFSVTYPTAAIPEPASATLFVIGGLGVLLGLQRRRGKV